LPYRIKRQVCERGSKGERGGEREKERVREERNENFHYQRQSLAALSLPSPLLPPPPAVQQIRNYK
jgi:hypothetical protein